MEVKDWGSKRTFFEQHGQHRVDGGRRPKSRPWPSALRGTDALLAGVEVGGLQHSRISPTLEPGLRTQHRSGEARSKRDGQKASSCEQPVAVRIGALLFVPAGVQSSKRACAQARGRLALLRRPRLPIQHARIDSRSHDAHRSWCRRVRGWDLCGEMCIDMHMHRCTCARTGAHAHA